ncbi:MAG: NAD(P)/FAD-dependent oxidoreductase [Candidatus Thermoplasmatota archaeon]|nr:NAD(P)/FAD-dependent oxidoreductase [Candidatus Thermoplasmatota archaeon]
MKCDVLVVGAGPAGSMAAKTIANENVDTVLIERSPHIGLPVRCAEGINKFLFNDTGIKINPSLVENKINGTKIYYREEVYDLNSEQWQGFTIDRSKFDAYLAEKAKQSGAKVFTSTKAVGLKKNRGKWVVEVISQGEKKTIKAKIIIGADGFESNIGEWASIKKKWEKNDIFKCFELYATCPKLRGNDRFHIFFGEEFYSGYGWIFPKKNKANIGVGVPLQSSAVDTFNNSLKANKRYKEIIGDSCSIIERRGGGVPMSGPKELNQTVGDGIILIGDAAGMVEPVTGEGISPSMISGIAAGEIVSTSIKDKNWNKTQLRKYETIWRNKRYMNTTLGTSMEGLLELKETFQYMFSDRATTQERKTFIHNISELT